MVASNIYAAPPLASETSPTTSQDRYSTPEDSDPTYTPNYDEPAKCQRREKQLQSLVILTAGEMSYTRPDGVHVVALGHLSP